MAVEAPHMALFPPQIIPSRDIVGIGHGNNYNDGTPFQPTPDGQLLPVYASSIMTDSVPAADSGLTCTLPRKRSRDSSSLNQLLSIPYGRFINRNKLNHSFTFLGEDISTHIYKQELEIDRFVALHTEKMRTEVEEMRKSHLTRLIAVSEEAMMKRLRMKEEELVEIGKLNLALQQKVKSLIVENQFLREIAQTNEATANALRSNLEQVLTEVQQQHRRGCVDEVADDAQSCCGSNYEEDRLHQKGKLTADGGVEEIKVNDGNPNKNEYCTSSGGGSSRSERLNICCRNCRKVESCVLLLPCRHLCLCTVCASSLNFCPVCNSTKDVTIHVNTN